MKCQHCKKDFEESKINEHHIHPRFMNNKAGVGKKLNLCEKCHNILHLQIPSYYWNLLNSWQQKKAIDIVEKISQRYGGTNDS